MARLLVLGRRGQLAQALAHHAAGAFEGVDCAGRETVDLATPGAVASHITSARPDVVINSAAYTAVDKAEDEEDLAHRINADAAGEAAAAAFEIGARFVHVSTDYVFGGDRGAPFAEGARPAPINAYGRSKLAGEQAVTTANPDAAIVRTAAVFSGRGDDFPSAIWAKGVAGEPLRVVDDQYTNPTFAGDLAVRLLALAQLKQASGIYHCAGQPSASWFDVATHAMSLLGTGSTPSPVPSTQFPRPAPRAKDTRLASTRLEAATGLPQPDWKIGLQSALDVWLAAR